MFLQDTIRNCMIETDVSSYLQTTSTGQVENFETFIQTRVIKKLILIGEFLTNQAKFLSHCARVVRGES